jgi:hypothetical protein
VFQVDRLEDALIDLAIVVIEGHRGRLIADIASDAVEARRGLQ